MSEKRGDVAMAATGAASAEPSTRWELPAMRGPVVPRGRAAARDLGADPSSSQAGYEAGHVCGLQAGLSAAAEQVAVQQALLQQQIFVVGQVLDALASPLRELDEVTERELCQLALTVAKQLARREISVDPTQVIAIVRATVGLLPASARHVRVHLHPADAAMLRERLTAPGHEAAWAIVEDPVMGRGGCRVSTDHAHIDARLESRVATLLGELCGEVGEAAGEASLDSSL